MKHYKDDPRLLSGWNHAYFCENDGGRLIFDIERPDYHECHLCGKSYVGFTYDCAHMAILRTEAAATAVKSALAYACGRNSQYLEYVTKIVEGYTKDYDRFPKSVRLLALDDAPRTGRVMTQAADEAAFIIRLLTAMAIVKKDLDNDWLGMVKEGMFVKAHDILKSQLNSISYDSCWISSALGVMGLFFDEPDWIREALTDEFGLYEQIEKGVTPDGFWHVGSIHQNFGVLEGITYFFAFANAYGFEVSEFSQQIVIFMYDACYKLAFDNGDLPCVGDGWPDVSLKTYMHCFCLACKAFGSTMKKYLRHIETLNIKRIPLPVNEPFYFENRIPLEKLIFAPSDDEAASEKRKLPKRGSKTYERVSQAMLRNEVFNVFIKYGHETSRYAHYDKMGIEIMAGMKMLTRDLSSTGYMSKLLNDWYRSGMAHNTCVVDGMRSDVKEPGRLIFYDDSKIVVESNPYPNVIFRRNIELDNNSLVDDFIVEYIEEEDAEDEDQEQVKPEHVKTEHRFEWFFHFQEPVDREQIFYTPTNALPGAFYIEPREIHTDEEILTLNLANNNVMRIGMFEGMRAFICKTPSNPACKLLDTLVLRVIGEYARFWIEIICDKE